MQEEIIKLLKKYGAILILFDILSRFGLTYGLQLYYEGIDLDNFCNDSIWTMGKCTISNDMESS